MKKLLLSMIGAGLAMLVAGGAHAQMITVKPTTTPSAITKTDGSGSITVAFQDIATSAPQNAFSGFDGTFLNYTISSTASTVGTLTFNDTFTLDVLFQDQIGGSHTSSFLGTVAGTANGTQNINVRALVAPTSETFTLNDITYTVEISSPLYGPTMNVTSPFSVTAHVAAVPEPGSMALLGTGLLPALGLLFRRRR